MTFVTSGTASDHLAFKAGPTNADISTARTGPYHDISGARQFTGVVSIPAVTQGSEVIVRLLQASDSGGTGSKALAETTYTIPADSPPVSVNFTLSADAIDSDLDDANGFGFVAVQIECDEAVAGSGALVLSGLRYKPTVLPASA